MGFREEKSLRETQRLRSFIPRRSLRQETLSEASKICIFRGRGSFRDQSGIYLLLVHIFCRLCNGKYRRPG
jgi:hypothetical protein